MKTNLSRRTFLKAAGASAAATLAAPAFGQGAAVASGLHLGGLAAELYVTPITEHTLRVSVLPAGSRAQPEAALAANGLRERSWPAAKWVVREAAGYRSMAWSGFRIEVGAAPLSVAVFEGEKVRQKLVFDDASGRVSFELLDAPVFGLGEGGHQFDRRGVTDAMRNGQFKPDQFVNGGRSPIPWLISPAGWGLYFHHPMGTFDLTGREGVFRPSVLPQAQDVFLVLAREPATLLGEFAQLTGLPHLPPLWALGYQQSHRTLGGREAVLEEARTFREKKLPCDAMIYLGTGYAPTGWNTGHASFDFNPKVFPDPAAMFREMHAEDFRVVLHVLGVPFDLHGRVLDAASDPDDAANYWRDHLGVFRTGIDGWWVDDGDELLPQARLDRNRMYWDGPLMERPNVRPFSIQRNGYAGLQQYGFLWSGDTNSQWDTLRTQIASGLNTGLSGIPYWGTDTGGFFSTKELTAELYVRWFQFSAFCPLFRSHGRTWMLRLPWGWNTGSLGPVEDDPKMLPAPEDLHHPEVEEICRKYLNLRYQLLPYLYSAVRETHTTGMPLMRALWLEHPGDAKALAVADAYLWGPSLLVAPVTEAGATARAVYLPEGRWFDFWTGETVVGGAEHSGAVDLATLPLYVKAGAIVPLGPVKQSALEKSDEPLELQIYPGADGRFALYEDDAVSMEHLRGMLSVVEMRWDDRARRLALALAAGSQMRQFTTRRFVATVVGSGERREIEFRGEPVSVAFETA